MEPKNNRKKLPLLLKIFLVVLTTELVFELFNLVKFFIYFGYDFVPQISYHIFGFGVSGIVALATTILINEVGKTILLVGVWKRSQWIWRYGSIYFAFLIINNIFPIFRELSYFKIFAIDFMQRLESFVIAQNHGLVMNEGLKITTDIIGVIIIVLIILVALARMTGLDILLLFIFYRKREYLK